MTHNVAILQNIRAALVEQRDASKTFVERIAAAAAVEAIEKMMDEQEPAPAPPAPPHEPPAPPHEPGLFGFYDDTPSAIAAAVMAFPWAMCSDIASADRRFGMVQEAAERILKEASLLPAPATPDEPVEPGYKAFQTFWGDDSTKVELWRHLGKDAWDRWARLEATLSGTNR